SAWAYLDLSGTEEDQNRVIVMKHDNQYALKLDAFANWQFFERNNNNWQAVLFPHDAFVWTHVAGVKNGGLTYLYVNGVEIYGPDTEGNNGNGRNTSSDLFIGR